jgi:hypothetical protein
MRAAVLIAIAACGGSTTTAPLAPPPVAQAPLPPPPPERTAEPAPPPPPPPVEAANLGTGAGQVGRPDPTEALGGERAGPTTSAGTPAITGPLDPLVVRRELARHYHDIVYCYSKRVEVDPVAAGRLVARIVISPDGTVKTATATGVHPDIETCVVERMKRWSFPTFASGVETVTFAFVLRPT